MIVPEATSSTPRWLPPPVLCTGLVALLFLPFVNKAFHIDDFYFLVWGELFDWNPFQALPKDFMHQGVLGKGALAYNLTHPLLIPYLLKGLQRLFGAGELPLHLIFLVFPLIALWNLAKLAALLNFDRRSSLLLLVLFATLPAFVVNGQNLMSDVPTLAFLLAGTASVVSCVVGEREALPWGAGIWLTCAVFASYQALAFVVLLIGFVLAGCRNPRQKRGSLLVLLLPLLLMVVWLGAIYGLYGVFPGQRGTGVGGELIRGSQLTVLWGRAIFVFALVGSSLLFVLPLHLALLSRKALLRIAGAGGLLLVMFFLAAPPEAGTVPRRAALAVFCAWGAVGIGCALARLRGWFAAENTRPAALLCGGWLVVTLLYNLVLLPFGSARYLLPVFPVLFMVLLRESRGGIPRPSRWVTVWLLTSLVWGGANAWADYNYAGTYRVMAAEIAEFRRALGPGQRVWYIGEWGMRHYFDQAGAHYLLADSREPKTGDYLVIPEMPRFWAPPLWLQARLGFYASREFRSPLPLRVFNRRSGAGFYCHHWGLLPFALSSEPDEVFIIQKVR